MSDNKVVKQLRQIYCVKGAAFCRPELEEAWLEIERLEAENQALIHDNARYVEMNTALLNAPDQNAVEVVELRAKVKRYREALAKIAEEVTLPKALLAVAVFYRNRLQEKQLIAKQALQEGD